MTFRDLALSLCENLQPLLTSCAAETTWSSPPKEGKSLELLTLVAIFGAVETLGGRPALPELAVAEPDLYFMRNEYPHHFGAQAGHSVLSVAASKRFKGALTPKFSFCLEGKTYSVFREGYPLHYVSHYLECGSTYSDRPDFVVVEGSYDVSSRNSICTYTIEIEGQIGVAEFREINSISPQVVSWEMEPYLIRPPIAAFECSWNKKPQTASKQLDRYRTLFRMGTGPNAFFVSARGQKEQLVPTITVTPDETSATDVKARFTDAVLSVLDL